MRKARPWIFALALLLLLLLLFSNRRGARQDAMITEISQDAALSRDGVDPHQEPEQASAAHEGPTASGSGAPSGNGDLGVRPSPPEEQGRVLVFGSVTMENGMPAEGARVYLLPFSGAKPPQAVQKITDSGGNFSYRGDLRGAYMLYAAKDNYLSFSSRRDLPRVVIGDQETSVGPYKLALREAARLTLRMRDHLSGKPIEDAHVRARGELNLNFYSDASGEARLSISPGIWSLEISAPGYNNRNMALDLNGNQPELIEVGLEAAGLVSGYVSDREGALLENSSVTCLSGGRELKTETDVDGFYFFDRVPLDRPFTLHFHSDGYEDAYFNWQRFSLGKTSREVNANLRALPKPDEREPRRLFGRVLGNENQPVAGAIVFFHQPGHPDYVETVSDGNGAFALEVQNADGIAHVGARAGGFAPTYQIIPGEDREILIELQAAHWLGGRVVDPWGAPVAGVALKVIGDAGPAGTMPIQGQGPIYTDAEGRFRIDDIPKQVSLRFWAWGYAAATYVPADLDRDDQEWLIQPLGLISGRLVDEDQQPISEFTVSVTQIQTTDDAVHSIDPIWHDPGVQFWNGDGAFRLTGLPPNLKLKLTISAPNFASETYAGLVALPEQDAQPYLLVMGNKGLRLAGTLTDHQGRPRAGARIQALAYDPDDPYNSYFSWTGFFRGFYSRTAISSPWTSTNEDGSFAFEGLPLHANLDLLVASPGTALEHLGDLEQKTQVERENLRISVADEATVTGIVSRVSFPSARRLELSLVRNQEFTIPVTLDDEAEDFSIGQLPPGKYRLRLLGWRQPTHPSVLREMEVVLAAGERRSFLFE